MSVENIENMPRGALARRNKRSGVEDKNLFLFAFGLGMLGIGVLKFGFGLPQLWVTAWPVMIMLGYAWYIWQTERFNLRDDRAGDGLYYLGFLYTLGSLGMALYLFNTESSGASEIISNFGIALATTITGLVLRVLFNQMREDPVEYEGKARVALSDTVARLRSELDDAINGIQGFQRATFDALDAGLQQTRKTTEAQMREAALGFAREVAEVFTQIKKAGSDFSTNAAALNKATNRVVEAAGQMCTRIEGIQPSTEVFDHKLNEIASKFDTVATKIDRTADACGSVTELAQETALALKAMHNEVSLVRDLSAALNGVQASLSGIASVGRAELDVHKEHLAGLRGAFQENVELLSQFRRKAQEAHRDCEVVVHALKATTRTMSDVTANLGGRADEVGNAIGTICSHLEQAGGSLEPLAAISGASSELAAEMARVTNAMRDTEALVARMGDISTRLDEADRALQEAEGNRKAVVSDTLEALRAELDSVRAIRAQLQQENVQACEAVVRVQQTLRSLVDSIREGLDECR